VKAIRAEVAGTTLEPELFPDDEADVDWELSLGSFSDASNSTDVASSQHAPDRTHSSRHPNLQALIDQWRDATDPERIRQGQAIYESIIANRPSSCDVDVLSPDDLNRIDVMEKYVRASRPFLVRNALSKTSWIGSSASQHFTPSGIRTWMKSRKIEVSTLAYGARYDKKVISTRLGPLLDYIQGKDAREEVELNAAKDQSFLDSHGAVRNTIRRAWKNAIQESMNVASDFEAARNETLFLSVGQGQIPYLSTVASDFIGFAGFNASALDAVEHHVFIGPPASGT